MCHASPDSFKALTPTPSVCEIRNACGDASATAYFQQQRHLHSTNYILAMWIYSILADYSYLVAQFPSESVFNMRKLGEELPIDKTSANISEIHKQITKPSTARFIIHIIDTDAISFCLLFKRRYQTVMCSSHIWSGNKQRWRWHRHLG